MNALYRLARILLFPVLHTVFPVKFEGLEKVPKTGGLVLCSNHVSYADPMFLILGLPRPVFFMAKAELFRNRIVGAFLRKLGAFPVKRGAGDTAALEQAVELVKNGHILGIYPEGTRSKDGTPKRAKSGVAVVARQTGADVLPVAVCSADGRVRPFRRTKIVIGDVIPNAALFPDPGEPNRAQIKAAANQIMDAVIRLRERGRAEWLRKVRHPES